MTVMTKARRKDTVGDMIEEFGEEINEEMDEQSYIPDHSMGETSARLGSSL